MRGAVSAGAASAINMLGLCDAVDVLYGSSAGALVAAYFAARQLDGTAIYSHILPTNAKTFVDRSQLLNAMGLRLGKSRPVINLDFLLEKVVKDMHPLDWSACWKMNRVQPIKVIASGLSSMKTRVLSSEQGHFKCLDSFLRCLRASMCVPGVAGPPIRVPSLDRDGQDFDELLADALLFEPMPFRSAVEEGCTHVICLRTRPDGSEILGKKASGIYERFIAHRFLNKHKSPHAARHMVQMDHIKQYAEDILLLNHASHSHEVKFPLTCFVWKRAFFLW